MPEIDDPEASPTCLSDADSSTKPPSSPGHFKCPSTTTHSWTSEDAQGVNESLSDSDSDETIHSPTNSAPWVYRSDQDDENDQDEGSREGTDYPEDRGDDFDDPVSDLDSLGTRPNSPVSSPVDDEDIEQEEALDETQETDAEVFEEACNRAVEGYRTHLKMERKDLKAECERQEDKKRALAKLLAQERIVIAAGVHSAYNTPRVSPASSQVSPRSERSKSISAKLSKLSKQPHLEVPSPVSTSASASLTSSPSTTPPSEKSFSSVPSSVHSEPPDSPISWTSSDDGRRPPTPKPGPFWSSNSEIEMSLIDDGMETASRNLKRKASLDDRPVKHPRLSTGKHAPMRGSKTWSENDIEMSVANDEMGKRSLKRKASLEGERSSKRLRLRSIARQPRVPSFCGRVVSDPERMVARLERKRGLAKKIRQHQKASGVARMKKAK